MTHYPSLNLTTENNACHLWSKNGSSVHSFKSNSYFCFEPNGNIRLTVLFMASALGRPFDEESDTVESGPQVKNAGSNSHCHCSVWDFSSTLLAATSTISSEDGGRGRLLVLVAEEGKMAGSSSHAHPCVASLQLSLCQNPTRCPLGETAGWPTMLRTDGCCGCLSVSLLSSTITMESFSSSPNT